MNERTRNVNIGFNFITTHQNKKKVFKNNSAQLFISEHFLWCASDVFIPHSGLVRLKVWQWGKFVYVSYCRLLNAMVNTIVKAVFFGASCSKQIGFDPSRFVWQYLALYGRNAVSDSTHNSDYWGVVTLIRSC